MATLKISYDNQEDIPEGLSDYYQEQDGKFILQAEGMKTQNDVDRVKAGIEAEREKRIELQKKVDAIPDDFDAEKWESVKHLDPESIPDASKINEKIAEVENRWKDKVSTAESEKADLQEKFKNTLIEKELTESLVEQGVDNKVRLEDAVTRIRNKHKPDLKEEDGKFKVIVGSLQEELPSFVKDWAASDEGKYYVTAKDNSGGGSNNQGGGEGPKINPYKQDSWNVTEQGKIEESDPAEAKRLAAQAGVPIDEQ